jgi:3-dehydroquinate synthase
MKSQILYSQALPKVSRFSEETVLFYDSVLLKNPSFKNWLKSFPYKIALKSGEALKTIESFNLVLNKISKLGLPQSTNLTFVAVGGGSVGDFVGFMASVYLRGRRLVLLPSTWLSAVDSAHGGKNGLNFLKTKNQIGSFYPAEKIYIVKDLLLMQPSERMTESMGEIIKIAVLSDQKLFSQLEGRVSQEALYKKLPQIISLKYKIVNRDPLEKKGTRRLLNLGHTMGHVFESYYGWPHGVAVLLGLQFAARWSLHRGLISTKDFFKISMLMDSLELKQDLNTALQKIPTQKIQSLLLKDKKLTGKARLDFIFIKKVGSCVRESVLVDQIIAEVQRQKLEY